MGFKSTVRILLLSAAWGISFLMMRVAVPDYPPLWIAWLRCGLGAALMWTFLVAGGRRLPSRRLPPRRLMPWLLLVALLNNALPFSLFAWGEVWVPSNTAAVLNATTPIWTLLLAATLDRRLPRGFTTLGVVRNDVPDTARGTVGAGGLWWGMLAIGVAAVCYAVASLLAKVKLKGLEPVGLATTQLSLATLLLAAPALLTAWPREFLAPAQLAAIAVLGFVGSGFTYLLPVWGVFWGAVGGEVIGPGTYLGVAITVCGLVLLNFGSARRGGRLQAEQG